MAAVPCFLSDAAPPVRTRLFAADQIITIQLSCFWLAWDFIKGIVMLTEFFKDDDGAQVVEYALIIAVISIALVVALQPLTLGASFGSFIDRVASCLTTTVCV
jgi:pilus assembly protein Flp/PilA